MRINYRIALSTIAPVALAVLLLTLIGLNSFRNALEENHSSSLESNLEILSQAMETHSALLAATSQAITSSGALQQYLTSNDKSLRATVLQPKLQSSLQKTLAANKYLSAIALLGPDNKPLVILPEGQSSPSAAFTRAQALAINRSLAGKLNPEVFLQNNGQPIMQYGSVLVSASATERFYLILEYKLTSLQKTVEKIRADSGLIVALYDSKGELIVTPAHDGELIRHIGDNFLSQNLSPPQPLSFANNSYQLLNKPFNNGTWVALIPDSALLDNSLGFALIILVALLAVAFIMLLFFSHRLITRPIQRLTATVQQKARGEVVSFVHGGDCDELSQLGQTLDRVFEEQQRAKVQIQNLAYYDTLTGLANRRLFAVYLDNAIDTAKRSKSNLALLFIDLDNFKAVNDNYGHQFGDQVLAEFANRIRGIVRSSDIISSLSEHEHSQSIARLAGDEFAVLLTSMEDNLTAANVADRLLESTREPILIEGHSLHIEASIGIAAFPEDASSGEELIRHADAAMYHAKMEGKHTYSFFSKSLSKQLSRQRIIRESLRYALQRNEFSLEFQPYVESQNYSLCGVEILLRWDSSFIGNVSPEEFIPVAESSGQIKDIDCWVISQACEIMHDWKQRGFPLIQCSVNISATELRNDKLPEFITTSLTKFGLEPGQLELEITENKLIDRDNRSLAMFNRLHETGVSLSLDNFGQGFTSLNQLKDYPVDRLKIDKDYIGDLMEQAQQFQTADVILQLSHSYGLAATAEGVENADQASYLSDAGCDSLQGYYFSYPLARETMERLLEIGRPRLPLSKELFKIVHHRTQEI